MPRKNTGTRLRKAYASARGAVLRLSIPTAAAPSAWETIDPQSGKRVLNVFLTDCALTVDRPGGLTLIAASAAALSITLYVDWPGYLDRTTT